MDMRDEDTKVALTAAYKYGFMQSITPRERDAILSRLLPMITRARDGHPTH